MSSAPSFRKLVDAVVETQQLQKTQFSRLRASPSRQMSYVLNVQQNNGLPVNLTCTSKTPTVTQTTASRSMYDATIEFSYEFTIFNPDQDPIEVLKQDVPLLEFFILYYVAQGTNILDCNVQNQGISLFAESASTSAGGAIDQPTVELLSLSSVSTDTRDLTIGKCLQHQATGCYQVTIYNNSTTVVSSVRVLMQLAHTTARFLS